MSITYSAPPSEASERTPQVPRTSSPLPLCGLMTSKVPPRVAGWSPSRLMRVALSPDRIRIARPHATMPAPYCVQSFAGQTRAASEALRTCRSTLVEKEVPSVVLGDTELLSVPVERAPPLLSSLDDATSGSTDASTPHGSTVLRQPSAMSNWQGSCSPHGPELRRLVAEVAQLRGLVQQQETCMQEQAKSLEDARHEIQHLKQVAQVVAARPHRAECTDSVPVTAPATTPSTFTIWLDKTAGGELGLELDESTLTVTVVDEVGLIAEWNCREPNKAVLPGCRIIEVNGERNAEPILDRLIRDLILEVTLATQ
eukprot:CAMPEP_0179085270 /NCGR_PEP_ID=MMETSP0796-20121207/38607_1 /TAXON_ID=73915 /ORGANISM="Pyrodinium bahamense, Strain pbaha01" /LENGTH=312 /DNA_ID=CAMNT_0020782703 /DNA_START=79 /DNA_END=1017 /DNA_ORIENTATION=-